LWCEPLKRETTKPLSFVAYDAAVFLMGFAFVSQGPSWRAIAVALPGLQYTLRDGIDRKGCCSAITLLSETSLLCGAGTFDELAGDGVIGKPVRTWIMPIDPVVALLRKRAADNQIALPKKLAPPLSEMPSWARGTPAWKAPSHSGGARVTWQPATGAFSVVCWTEARP
jgi:hypothetical protein